MMEKPEAFERFRNATVKTIVSVPNSALPPSPFRKWVPKKEEAAGQEKQDLELPHIILPLLR
jgi:hypothetical protein